MVRCGPRAMEGGQDRGELVGVNSWEIGRHEADAACLWKKHLMGLVDPGSSVLVAISMLCYVIVLSHRGHLS